MSELGPFSERTPEEKALLGTALGNIASAGYTKLQLEHLLADQGAELADDADDKDRRNYYVTNHPDYAAAVRDEYTTLIAAVEALAKYYAAQDTTYEVRASLESEANQMLRYANQVANLETVTVENILPGDSAT